ncbi:MAG: ribosomal L7Ae/L30e/S12e/Gadd45 family protein [Clostridia bacterium]|nr:ribosomal L7Ae/L30e/S12e/Gadd45 family protein [Clostridia bacterium]
MNDKENKVSSEKSEGIHKLRCGSEQKLLGLLGFAARARKLVCGTDLCRDEIRRGRIPLALVASDASANTTKRIADACKFYGTELCRLPITASELSARIGKTANIAVIGVTDMNFVNGIAALIDDSAH